MINVTKFANLGSADYGWLKARYHFSFSNYYDPKRMGFGNLRVINDDEIKPGQGFQPHPHSNMEIITYVREGEVRHKDSLGNEGSTKAGDVQVMSAGTGIVHSEFSSETENTKLYQIWILPNQNGVEPRWETRAFPKEYSDKLQLLVSGRKTDEDKSVLFIYQDAAIYGGLVRKDTEINHQISNKAYILVSKGSFEVNGQKLYERDGAEVEAEKVLNIKALEDGEILVIDLGN